MGGERGVISYFQEIGQMGGFFRESVRGSHFTLLGKSIVETYARTGHKKRDLFTCTVFDNASEIRTIK